MGDIALATFGTHGGAQVSRARRVRIRAAVVVAVLVSSLLIGQQSAHAVTMTGFLTYERTWANPSDGRLWYRPTYDTAMWWRSGSGTGSQITNDCAIGKGWLPVGWYDQWGHWENYNGTAIWGNVFWLSNKSCWNGSVTRTELFIHSEMKQDGTQHATYEPQRWDGTSDYASNGCVKLSPSDILNWHHYYHYTGGIGLGQHGQFTIPNFLHANQPT